jgi:hypothetical protein
MVDPTTQTVALGGAALASMLVAFVWVAIRRRRRNARRHQAEQQAAYDAAVTAYRAAVAAGHRRRTQLVELLEVAFAGRSDRALTSAGSPEIDDAVSRLYLDLALAGEDHVRREGVLRVVRRGISDVELLMPEVPLPPDPAARLGRRARRRAAQWQGARTGELDALRALLHDGHVQEQQDGHHDCAGHSGTTTDRVLALVS